MSARKVLAAFAFVASTVGLAASPADAQTGTGIVSGRVTDAATGQPIASAQVNVVGTTIGALTTSEGRYTLRGVRAGTAEVRALRVGYGEVRQPVTVAAGQTVTLDFAMRQVAAQLSAVVVTTATGEQRAVELGNAIAQVNAAEVVATRPVANMADLLTARAAGVQVLPGNQTGVGSRVRIRGTSSLSLSNNPIYVIDGIRVESSTGSSSIGVGGSNPSRVNDINPEEIESIEVVRGPSAATLYGTDAANGVIVIKTKRGVAGPARWTFYTEQSTIQDRNDYPTSYRAWRTGTTSSTTSTPGNNVQCVLTQVAAGQCTQDSVTTFNVYADPTSSPLANGSRQQYGLQLSGGSERARYFLSGEYENEDGVTRMPDFEVRRLRRNGIRVRDEWRDPNALRKLTGRVNLNLTVNEKADVATSVGFIRQDQRLPQSDDNTTGLGSNAFGGLGYKFNTIGNDTLYGYRQFTPGDIFQETVEQLIDRFIGSVNGNWRPLGWLALRSNFGLDFVARQDTDLCRFNTCSNFGTQRQGFKIDNRTNFNVYTVDVGATGSFQPTAAIGSKTTVGVQFNRNTFDRNGASGTILPAGATTVTAAAVKGADESHSESRTLGAYVEEAVSFRERLFLTAAVRSDRNSAFGADFETVFYPKAQVSWILSEEPFVPRPSWLNLFRVRAAYGASGVQPGTTDAVQFFLPTALRSEGVETPAIVFSTLGNRELRPERSTELEAGLDGDFWDNRVKAEVTYYNKRSKDALVERVLPPSIGTGATVRFENLGEVRNWGWEGLLSAELIRRERFGWDVLLNGSTNSNRLQSLGGVPPIIGTSIRQIEGYPLNGYWGRPLRSFDDANDNGIIEVSEIVVGDTAEFIGYSQPRHEVAFTNGFDFWNRRLRFRSMFDYKGGHKLYFNSERIRCQSRNNCRGLIDPKASLFEQARVVALREHPSRTLAGFFEDASFVRLRELALTVDLPSQWAARLAGSDRVTATFAARNLKVWTDYLGVDPESNYSTGDVPVDFQAAAPPSYFTLRLTVGF